MHTPCNDWAAAASPHLYGSRPERSYVVEVTTSTPIRHSALQFAVDKTVELLPYYSSTFCRRSGLYYHVDNPAPMQVENTDAYRVLGSSQTNGHMMDVTWWDNRIRFCAFHGLTDGQSFTWFVELVMYYYFCNKDSMTYPIDGLESFDVKDAEEALTDAFTEKRRLDLRALLRNLNNNFFRFRLPEARVKHPEDSTYLPVRIPADKLLGWAKHRGASPASALAGMMAKVVAHEHPRTRRKVTMCVQTSLRRALGIPHTLKNCSACVYLPFSAREANSLPIAELALRARTTLKEQIGPKCSDELCGVMGFLFKLGARIPVFGARSFVMSLMERFPFDTLSIDYAGRLAMGEYAQQVTDVRYYLSEPFRGSLYLVINECAGTFLINFVQSFESDRYYRAFLRLLAEEGITYEELPSVRYRTPDVALPVEPSV